MPGEAAEDILEGLVCQVCGEWMEDILEEDDVFYAPGYPRTCQECLDEYELSEEGKHYA